MVGLQCPRHTGYRRRVDACEPHREQRPSVRLIGAALLVALLAAGCSGLATAQGTQPAQTAAPEATPEPTPAFPDEDLFALNPPRIHPIEPTAATNGEFVVPDFCRATGAGLRRHGEGFLLVVQVSGDIPDIDSPPALPFGVLLMMHDLSLGLFASAVRSDLGASFTHIRQYQIRDRPSNLIGRLGSGEQEPFENVDVEVRGNEFRVLVPEVGADTENVTEWGFRLTCILRHPVDGVYFPQDRIPPEQFDRLPLE